MIAVFIIVFARVSFVIVVVEFIFAFVVAVMVGSVDYSAYFE